MAKRRSSANNTKAIVIAAIAVILIIAIAICVLYFAFPKTWNDIMSAIRDNVPGLNDSDDDNHNSSLVLGDGELKVHFIDVGQGDCIYIQFPDGDDMIIDCGQKGSGVSSDQPLEYLLQLNANESPRTINHLMLTHADEDHVDFLDEVIDKFNVENIYMPNILAAPNGTGKEAQKLRTQIEALDPNKIAKFTDPDAITTNTYANFFVAALTEENCTIHLNMDKDKNTTSIVIEDTTYRLKFYCPTEEYYASTDFGKNNSNAERKNAVSPIGILEYNNRRVVLTGDSNEINEPIFIERIGHIDCDVLKVAHHGSETSSSTAFLNAVTCEYAVISCGTGNDYNHPTQAALDRFNQYSMTVYRTDKNGTVVLTINGEGALSFDMTTETTQEENYIGADTASAATASIPMWANLWF